MDAVKKNSDGTTSGQPSVPCFPCPPLTTIKFITLKNGHLFVREMMGDQILYFRMPEETTLFDQAIIDWVRPEVASAYDGAKADPALIDEMALFRPTGQPPVGFFYGRWHHSSDHSPKLLEFMRARSLGYDLSEFDIID